MKPIVASRRESADTVADRCVVAGRLQPFEMSSLTNMEGGNFNDLGGIGAMPVLVNESGLYAVIMTGKTKQALRFRAWVTGEVLPAIRRTGCQTWGRRARWPFSSTGGCAMPKTGPDGKLELTGPAVLARAEADAARNAARLEAQQAKKGLAVRLPDPKVHKEGQKVFTTSLDVAEGFGKTHAYVLKRIRQLIEDAPELHEGTFALMFSETIVGQGAARKDPYYIMNRAGFLLLIGRFTGAAPILNRREASHGR